MIREQAPANLALDNPLWQLAIDLWRHRPFADCCLAAQDEGWVVSHILVALYGAEQGLRWNGMEPAGIKAFRKEVTDTLRSLRMEMARKPATSPQQHQDNKKAELEAERIELAWWCTTIHKDDPNWQPVAAPADALARDNLQRLPAGPATRHQDELMTLWQEYRL